MANAINRNRSVSSLASGLAMCLVAASSMRAQRQPSIQGWTAMMNYDTEYNISLEPLRRFGGDGSLGAAIESRAAFPFGSALLMQSIRADAYRGHRVRFAGWLRTEDVDGQAGLFARVDGAGIVEASDFMIGRPVMGTTAWRRYEIVLDVPRDAIGITFGCQLTGTGQMNADDFALDAVDATVAITTRPGNVALASRRHDGNGNGDAGVVQAGTPRDRTPKQLRAQQIAYSRTPLHPVNLDFEQ